MVKLTVANADIERIQHLVKISPDFVEHNFHWPFDVNGVVTFTSKENLFSKFEHIYDARGKSPDDIDEDNKISSSRLNDGNKVLVKHIPVTWSAIKNNIGTLKLQSILLLEDNVMHCIGTYNLLNL